MREELIVRHCSPTLAGLKTGNMFACPCEDIEEVCTELRRLNSKLVKKGLRMQPLKYSGNRALIYVFRPAKLLKDLQDNTACRLLRERGYCCETPERCVAHLMRRLGESSDFPHEIGLFLGYPPEDVNGFIENKADGYKSVGYWKVYGDEEKAQKLFEKYDKCTKVYCEHWAKGSPIEKLTVNVNKLLA